MKSYKVKMFPVLLGLLVVPSWCSLAFAKAEAAIKFHYRMPPPTTPLPMDLQTIVILPTEVNGQADGNTIDWDHIVRGMLRQLFERYRNQYAPGLLIQDRQDMGVLDDERGRIESGSLYGADDTAELKQAAGDMLLISKIQYNINRIQGHKKQPDIASTVSSFIPWHWYYYGHPHAESREVSEVAYNITVTCEFKLLISGRGGEPFRTYSDTLTNHEKTKSSLFLGIGSKSEADLTPVEEIIRELVEQHILAFLSPVIPMRGTEVAYVSTHSHGTKRKAVNALDAGNWNEAFHFAYAVARKHRHYDKAYFVMGLACEKLGKLKRAKGWYERAERQGHDPQYAQGVARINRRLAAAAASESDSKPDPLASSQHNRSQDSQPIHTDRDGLSSLLDQLENGPVQVSTRVSPETAASLRRAADDGSGKASQSERMAKITNSALKEWLRKHPQNPDKGQP